MKPAIPPPSPRAPSVSFPAVVVVGQFVEPPVPVGLVVGGVVGGDVEPVGGMVGGNGVVVVVVGGTVVVVVPLVPVRQSPMLVVVVVGD